MHEGAIYHYLHLPTCTHTYTVCELRSGGAQNLISFLSGGKQHHKQYVNITELLCRLTQMTGSPAGLCALCRWRVHKPDGLLKPGLLLHQIRKCGFIYIQKTFKMLRL